MYLRIEKLNHLNGLWPVHTERLRQRQIFNGDTNVKSDYSHTALVAMLTLYNEWVLHPLKRYH